LVEARLKSYKLNVSPPQRAVTDHLSRVSATGAYTVGGIFLSTGRRFTSLIWI